MKDVMRELRGMLQWESKRWLEVHHKPFKRLARNDPCAYCGNYRRRMNWDHIIPTRNGGINTNNLTRSCKKCNLKKGHKSLLMFLYERNKKRRALYKW
jgi:5-methylcytosine-specific restriction endonuclease McrA